VNHIDIIQEFVELYIVRVWRVGFSSDLY
jgi:hypothetical protein